MKLLAGLLVITAVWAASVEVRYSHQRHAAMGTSCTSCHAGAEKSARARRLGPTEVAEREPALHAPEGAWLYSRDGAIDKKLMKDGPPDSKAIALVKWSFCGG